jgi:TRAP-type C4-dicarboxylate transport system permease small subunit
MANESTAKGTRFTRWLSCVGNVALVLMMVLTTVDVCGRYFFNRPVLGAYEITEYLMLIMVFSYLALAQAEKAHINVDIVYNRLPHKLQAILERFNYLVCLVLWLLVVGMGVFNVYELKRSGDMSTLLKIPDYPFGIFLVIGGIALCMEFFSDLVRPPPPRQGAGAP